MACTAVWWPAGQAHWAARSWAATSECLAFVARTLALCTGDTCNTGGWPKTLQKMSHWDQEWDLLHCVAHVPPAFTPDELKV
jgi:hypothetical protein